MAYNPAQPRQAGGKFGTTGAPAKVTGYVPIPPAVMAQARAQIAAAQAKAKAQARLTPRQRAQARQVAVARSLMAAQRRAALAKTRKAKAAANAAQARRARLVAGHARAVALGTAAGRRTPAGRNWTIPSTGRGRAPSAGVQANLRRYLATP